MKAVNTALTCLCNELLNNFGANATRSRRANLSNMAREAKNSKPFSVFVEGNIGCGKTTFLKHFSALDNVTTLAEPVECWRNVKGENFLDLMYSDPSRWGITFQTYVQLTMLDLHTRPVEHPIKMMERSIHSARYCFVENLYQTGLMPKPDFLALDEWFNWIAKNHDIGGNLIIYLRTTPEVVHKRMLSRARSEESCVPLEYLERLHHLHESWLYHRTSFSCSAPVITIDANKDLAQMSTDFLQCQTRILDALASLCNERNTTSSPSKMNVPLSPIKVASLS